MANMAVDSYLPHRFSQLSDRLTMSYGVLLMGGASLLALVYTGGNVAHLVVMYSINVFLTFSLSELSMCRFWIRERKKDPSGQAHLDSRDGPDALSVHSLLTVQRLFPDHFRSFLFVSIGVIGSASFVNVEAVEEVRCQSGVSLRRQYWQGVATPWRDAIRGGHRAGVSRGYGSCHHSGRP